MSFFEDFNSGTEESFQQMKKLIEKALKNKQLKDEDRIEIEKKREAMDQLEEERGTNFFSLGADKMNKLIHKRIEENKEKIKKEIEDLTQLPLGG